MPKISTNEINIYHDDIKKALTIVVMYNQKFHFYAEIPNEFYSVVHHLPEDKLTELSIRIMHESKRWHSVNDPHKKIIVGDSESECLVKMKKCLEFLVDKSVQKRDVIILFYNPKDITNYNEHLMNNEHPMIGLQYGLTYAVETSVGDKKVYSIYTEYEAFGRKNTNRRELSLWNKSSVIIPDTPHNRETLEQLYHALIALNEKLKSFTSTPEKLLEFIQSNIKLLN